MTWKCLRLTCLLYKGIHTSKCTENTSFIYPLSCDYFNLSIFIHTSLSSLHEQLRSRLFFFPWHFQMWGTPLSGQRFSLLDLKYMTLLFLLVYILNLMFIFINIFNSNLYIYIYMTGRYFINLSLYLTLYNISLSHIFSQKTLPTHSPS